jgi:hypothetical protein
MLISPDPHADYWKLAVSRKGFLSFGDYNYGGILDIVADWILRVESANHDWDDDRDILCLAMKTVLLRVCKAEVPRQVGPILTNGWRHSIGVFFADIDDPLTNSKDFVVEIEFWRAHDDHRWVVIEASDVSRRRWDLDQPASLENLDAWVGAQINPRIG